MERAYPCEFCDTDKPLETRLVTLILSRKGHSHTFENIPALVCPICAHRYYDGPMILELERMIDEKPEQTSLL